MRRSELGIDVAVAIERPPQGLGFLQCRINLEGALTMAVPGRIVLSWGQPVANNGLRYDIRA